MGAPETIVRDLTGLVGGEIAEDSSVDCLLSGDMAGKKEVEYRLAEGRELTMSLVDLSESDIDLHISVHLARKSRCEINVASICQSGKRKVITVDVVHEEPDSFSRTKMAGINLGNGTLFFFGTSDVWNAAHGSDTRQEGKITNLSHGSRSEVSPALLIKNNDVNASHGAALGAYDPEAMYYMMSRGLTEAESRRLITIGSLVPVIESLHDKELSEEATKALEALDL